VSGPRPARSPAALGHRTGFARPGPSPAPSPAVLPVGNWFSARRRPGAEDRKPGGSDRPQPGTTPAGQAGRKAFRASAPRSPPHPTTRRARTPPKPSAPHTPNPGHPGLARRGLAPAAGQLRGPAFTGTVTRPTPPLVRVLQQHPVILEEGARGHNLSRPGQPAKPVPAVGAECERPLRTLAWLRLQFSESSGMTDLRHHSLL